MNASDGIAARVRALAEFLVENDLQSLSIERSDETFEVARVPSPSVAAAAVVEAAPAPIRIDRVAADRVGIFHFARPAPFSGEILDGDRELGYVEQLGIRHPIRSRGGGRIVRVMHDDGDIVDYGRPLFEIERP